MHQIRQNTVGKVVLPHWLRGRTGKGASTASVYELPIFMGIPLPEQTVPPLVYFLTTIKESQGVPSCRTVYRLTHPKHEFACGHPKSIPTLDHHQMSPPVGSGYNHGHPTRTARYFLSRRLLGTVQSHTNLPEVAPARSSSVFQYLPILRMYLDSIPARSYEAKGNLCS
eukprot:scaffold1560_cov394-Pavlova_lutheri.AAC.2